MRRAKSFVAMGEMELMSTKILPGVRPAATPFSPKSTSSTLGVFGTMVMMPSVADATSRAERQSRPPLSTSSVGAGLWPCR